MRRPSKNPELSQPTARAAPHSPSPAERIEMRSECIGGRTDGVWDPPPCILRVSKFTWPLIRRVSFRILCEPPRSASSGLKQTHRDGWSRLLQGCASGGASRKPSCSGAGAGCPRPLGLGVGGPFAALVKTLKSMSALSAPSVWVFKPLIFFFKFFFLLLIRSSTRT